MRTYKKKARVLTLGQDAKDVRRLNAAFLQTMAALPCRPEPRWKFDFVAMAEPRRNHSGDEAVSDCRIVLRAAVATGDREIVNTTRRAIRRYFDECGDAAIAEVPENGIPSLAEATKDVVREAGQAQHATVCAALEPTEGNVEEALRQQREAVESIEDLEAVYRTELAIRQGRRHMEVAR